MEEKESSGGPEREARMAFFIMPTVMLRSLRQKGSELMTGEQVRRLLFECGADCGRAMVKKMDITDEDRVDIGDTITALWIEIGLGRLHVESREEGELVVNCDDSTEALANGKTGEMMCDLTRGYLVGIASALSGHAWDCEETRCLSHGDPECTYILRAK
ncbi:MAG: V4R domain-containing protein [Thermoplasmata archaeon]